MPEKIGMQVSVPNKEVPPLRRSPTLNGVLEWIKSKNLTPELENIMIRKAKRYPHNALERFMQSFPEQVIKAQKSR